MRLRRLFALLLVVCTIFAIPGQALATTNENFLPAATTSNSFHNSTGIFTTYHSGTFTVSSSTYTSVILTVKGTTTDDNVNIRIYTNYRTYLDKTVSADSQNIWHVTLPAVNYEVMVIGGTGNYAYSINIYPYYG